jgi:hypothetical protein
VAGTSCARAPTQLDGSSNEHSAPSEQTAVQQTTPTIQREFPYPRGRWRLAPGEQLTRVVLWFSHILIRYDDVPDANVSFSLVEWGTAPPSVSRSRDQALSLARRAAEEAASGKVAFAELAAAYSEDVTTRDRAGSLGGMTAANLVPWGQILDALAVLKPGEVSKVVETPFGFHVLRRHAPPPEQTLSGSRIVIGHDDAPALSYFHFRGDIAHRSKSEAETLARELSERARHNPDEFPELVERYSEHMDAEAQGDLGAWSVREAQAPAREIDTLARLRVGEVSPPIDTALGFQILMRTADRERPVFAHEALELRFDPRAPPGSPDSEAAARELALQLAERLKHEPQAFDSLQRELYCLDTHVWREGRREKSIQAALSALSIGAISPAPVRTAAAHVLLRRLDPERVVPSAPTFELPSPIMPDIDALLRWTLDDATAERLVRGLGPLVAAELKLQGERRASLLDLHELRAGLGSGQERADALVALANRTNALLDPTEQRRYRELAVGLVEQAVLDSR